MSVLTTENHDAIRVITLNRPEKRNALNHELTSGLIEALEAADADEDIRAVILAGTGKGFCAGADLGEFASLTPDNADLVAKRAALTCRLQSVIATMGKPPFDMPTKNVAAPAAIQKATVCSNACPLPHVTNPARHAPGRR